MQRRAADEEIAKLVTALSLSELTSEERAEIFAQLSADDLRKLHVCWPFWKGKLQDVPNGDWRVWMILAGRGFGKTRVGAEWVRALAKANPGIRIALVGATLAEARAVMVEGESGVISVSRAGEIASWKPSRGLSVGKMARGRSFIRRTIPKACAGRSIISRGVMNLANGGAGKRHGIIFSLAFALVVARVR